MDKTDSFISIPESWGESILRTRGYSSRALLLLLLGLIPCTGQSLAQQLETRLQEHGRYLVENAPGNVKNGSPLVKAKYAFIGYCQFLNGQRQGVNSNLANQVMGYRSGDTYMLQCGWHNNRLKDLMGRMGISENDMTGVVADANSSLPYLLSPNQEHGALAVRDKDGQVYIFDPWELAVNNVIVSTGLNVGAYAGAETSKWNGMKTQLWDTEMRAQGYVRFNDQQQLDANYALDLQTVINRKFGTTPDNKNKWVLDSPPVIEGASDAGKLVIRINDASALYQDTFVHPDGTIRGSTKASFAFTPPPKVMIPNEKITMMVTGDYSCTGNNFGCAFRINSMDLADNASSQFFGVYVSLSAETPHREMMRTFVVPENLQLHKGKLRLKYVLSGNPHQKTIEYTYTFKN